MVVILNLETEIQREKASILRTQKLILGTEENFESGILIGRRPRAYAWHTYPTFLLRKTVGRARTRKRQYIGTELVFPSICDDTLVARNWSWVGLGGNPSFINLKKRVWKTSF